jgi:16S rRNA (uracil1498-N3)-methyltransferase
LSLPRFHVTEAAPGARLHLPDTSAHHAREVLRLRAGAAVRVFDGRGSEYDAVLDLVARQGVTARVTGPAQARPESALKVALALSPLKGDRMELVVQKATELGVTAIHPVVTARTDAAARPALKGSRQERWEKVASGAAEQCGRAVVPHVAPTVVLDEFLSQAPPGLRLLFLEVPGQPGLRSFPAAQEVVALVGPAGGWDPREVERLAVAGFQPVGLGPRVLRAETAAVVAVAALQALWGDLA